MNQDLFLVLWKKGAAGEIQLRNRHQTWNGNKEKHRECHTIRQCRNFAQLDGCKAQNTQNETSFASKLVIELCEIHSPDKVKAQMKNNPSVTKTERRFCLPASTRVHEWRVRVVYKQRLGQVRIGDRTMASARHCLGVIAWSLLCFPADRLCSVQTCVVAGRGMHVPVEGFRHLFTSKEQKCTASLTEITLWEGKVWQVNLIVEPRARGGRIMRRFRVSIKRSVVDKKGKLCWGRV